MPEPVIADLGTDPDAVDRLRRVRGFVFDMDGTLVLGDRRNHGLKPLPGALEFANLLVRQGVPFVVFTNGTTRAPAAYAESLRSLGFEVTDSAVLTPVTSAADCFRQRGHRRVMVLGGDGLHAPLREAGFETVGPVRDSGADAVLVGWYREVSFDDIEAACDAVWAGAGLYSSSQSRFFATAEGKVLGTSRAISAAVHDLTGAPIEVVGKPSGHALRAAAHRLGLRADQVAVVGDDPELEMVMARQGGALAVSVATGVHAHSLDDLPADQQPHLSCSGVDELMTWYVDGLSRSIDG
jgi:NagD protein